MVFLFVFSDEYIYVTTLDPKPQKEPWPNDERAMLWLQVMCLNHRPHSSTKFSFCCLTRTHTYTHPATLSWAELKNLTGTKSYPRLLLKKNRGPKKKTAAILLPHRCVEHRCLIPYASVFFLIGVWRLLPAVVLPRHTAMTTVPYDGAPTRLFSCATFPDCKSLQSPLERWFNF